VNSQGKFSASEIERLGKLMNQVPDPNDLPEVEKFIDWLYSAKHISDNFNEEQLREAMMIGIACATSRDGGAGSEFHSIIKKAICELREIEHNPIHQAKPATVNINAPKALIQQSLSAQAQILRKVFGQYVNVIPSMEGKS
jgi:hypothetical protein